MRVKNIEDPYISSNKSAIWHCYKDILFAHGFRARLVEFAEKTIPNWIQTVALFLILEFVFTFPEVNYKM